MKSLVTLFAVALVFVGCQAQAPSASLPSSTESTTTTTTTTTTESSPTVDTSSSDVATVSHDTSTSPTVEVMDATASETTSTASSSALPEYTLAEVSKHSTQSDCWTVIDGNVGDITSFFGQHPGGDRDLAKACGKDASVMFAREREHNPKGYEQFQEFIIGTLKK